MADEQANVIVVGVDHSDGAKEALRFALEEARLRHARLRIVHAWQVGASGVVGADSFFPVAGPDVSEIRDAAEQALEQTLRDALPDTGSVEIERRLVEGLAAGVLVDESRDASLLVVGSRGYGGFTGLLLGSVSQQVSHHARCPVVIVRPAKER